MVHSREYFLDSLTRRSKQDHRETARRRMATDAQQVDGEGNKSIMAENYNLRATKMSEFSLANRLREKYTTHQPGARDERALRQVKQP